MDTHTTDALDRADMERLVAGEDAALDALMERHAAKVFHFVFRMLGREEEAEDVAQETFVRVHRARASYRPSLRFSTWLFTIAANLARSQIRREVRHPSVSLEAELPDGGFPLADRLPSKDRPAPQVLEATERIEAVRKAVRDLPDDLREAIVLCEWEEMAVAEAARVLQTTPKAVESRLYRARKLLREALRGWL